MNKKFLSLILCLSLLLTLVPAGLCVSGVAAPVFQAAYMTAAAGSKLFEDEAMNSSIGNLGADGVIYAQSQNGSVVTVLYAKDNEAQTGYIPADSLTALTKSEVKEYLKLTPDVVTEDGIQLLNLEFEITPEKRNAITLNGAKVVLKASAKPQTYQIVAKVLGGAKVTYRSEDSQVKVSDTGLVTLPKYYSGEVKIKVSVDDCKAFKGASRYVRIIVQKTDNKITAKNVTLTASRSAQKVNLNAKCLGNAKMTYSSNNNKVTVNAKGVITVKAGFVGKAVITITAKESSIYKSATKKITVTVKKGSSPTSPSESESPEPVQSESPVPVQSESPEPVQSDLPSYLPDY